MIDSATDGSRLSALGQLHDHLVAALDLSDTVEEFLLSAQIALALDTARGALAALEVGIGGA